MNFFQKLKEFFFGKQKVTKTRNLKDIDALRGMHTGRAAEQSKFALQLKEKYLNKPVHETYTTGHVSGAAPIVTNVASYTTKQITDLLRKESGSYFTGRIKTYTWTHKNVEYFNCLAEMIHLNEYGNFVSGWQGPQPNIGFYNARSLYMSIEGPEPKIKGANYEPNT